MCEKEEKNENLNAITMNRNFENWAENVARITFKYIYSRFRKKSRQKSLFL